MDAVRTCPYRYSFGQSFGAAARASIRSRTSSAGAPAPCGPTSLPVVTAARRLTKAGCPPTIDPLARALSACATAWPVKVTHHAESPAAAPQGENQLRAGRPV